MKTIKTYICSNSKCGFYSLQNKIINTDLYKTYIIKGGPGTGKSTFMKKIGKAFENQADIEYIYCSSDSNSLDGLLINNKIIIFDGTAPHLQEPPIPGAGGNIINIGEYWNESQLENKRKEIIDLSSKISDEYKDTYIYLSAAGKVDESVKAQFENKINIQKLDNYIKNYTKRFIKDKKCSGKITNRFLGAYNFTGYNELSETLTVLAKNVTVLTDKYNIVAPVFLKKLSSEAYNRGYEVIEFYSPLSPDLLEHIAIPELDISFTVSEKIKEKRSINCLRFLDGEINYPNRLKFLYKIKAELINEAINKLINIKKMHDNLEKQYIPAMNFIGIEKLSKEYINKIQAIL